MVKGSKRHKHKEIELRLLRTVTPVFPNSLLLSFANVVLAGFKGGCIFVHIYMVHTLQKIIFSHSQTEARIQQWGWSVKRILQIFGKKEEMRFDKVVISEK